MYICIYVYIDLHADQGGSQRLVGDLTAVPGGPGVAQAEEGGPQLSLPTPPSGVVPLLPDRHPEPLEGDGGESGAASEGSRARPHRGPDVPLPGLGPERAQVHQGSARPTRSRQGCRDHRVAAPASQLSGHCRTLPRVAPPQRGAPSRSPAIPPSDPGEVGRSQPDVSAPPPPLPQRRSAFGRRHNEALEDWPQPPSPPSREAAAVALIAEPREVLGLQLNNPGNHCYANAFVLALLWSIAHTPSGVPVQLPFCRLARWLLRKPLHTALWDIPAWRTLTARWEDPHVQHDVAEFAQFLGAATAPASAEGVWQSRIAVQLTPSQPAASQCPAEVAEHGQMWPLSLAAAPPPEGSEISLQALVIQWRNQAHRHAAVSLPRLLIIQIGRFSPVGLKLRFAVRPSHRVYVPVFLDDTLRTTSAGYDLAAVVCHLGPSRSSGHYRSVLFPIWTSQLYHG